MGDISSPGSSRHSRDSLFKPTRPTGLFSRDLPLKQSVLKPGRGIVDTEITTSTSERSQAGTPPSIPSQFPMEPPKQAFPPRSSSGSSGLQLSLTKGKNLRHVGVQTEAEAANRSMRDTFEKAGILVAHNLDSASTGSDGPQNHVLVHATSNSGHSTNTVAATEDSEVIPETDIENSEFVVSSKKSTHRNNLSKLKKRSRIIKTCARSFDFEAEIEDYDDDESGDRMFIMEDEEAIVSDPQIGSLVLAKWAGDGYFYPGRISGLHQQTSDPTEFAHGKYTIFFDDGDQRIVRGCDMVLRKMLPIGCNVMAQVTPSGDSQESIVGEPEFEPAVILGHISKSRHCGSITSLA
jgi:hypothetical protein